MPTDEIKQILMDRLEKIGMDLCLIPGFIKSLESYLLHNPQMNLIQVNAKLHYLGWGDLALDYHTLQLAIEYFEAEEFKRFCDTPSDYRELRAENCPNDDLNISIAS